VDFFTPVVDAPYDWGRIAAANALSDIYAMGGRPLTALQLVGWPRSKLPFEVLSEVMAGGADVMAIAHCEFNRWTQVRVIRDKEILRVLWGWGCCHRLGVMLSAGPDFEVGGVCSRGRCGAGLGAGC